MRLFTKIISGTFIILLLFSGCTKQKDFDQMITELFTDKEDVTILVTDSGLGGLSVAADVASRLPTSGIFKNARIVFFNSLFHNRSGYNSLKTEAEKIRIFNTALKAMAKKYPPDLLLIACNTLSVFYDKTPFSKKAKFPVIGIVETGVKEIVKEFDNQPDAAVIIFATKTTIASNSHRDQLIAQGYPANQIIGQACHKLAGSIERGYDSEETIKYILQYVGEALSQIEQPETPIFASLNCTHFGYSMQQFNNAFAEAGYPDVVIIDPNPKMANFLFEPSKLNRFPETNITVEVVSKTEITPDKMASLGSLLEMTSPKTADALLNYKFDPDLFNAKFDSSTIEQK